jgi:Xaa-Pro aminopeptidase
MNKNYLYPSFDTIAGSGENGAIVHYRAKKENCRTIDKKDIFLCDSGGQYKYWYNRCNTDNLFFKT